MLFTCVSTCASGKFSLLFTINLAFDGISLLEESLADVMLFLDDVYLLLCGDLNSRTANKFPISQSENDVFACAVENTSEMFGGFCIEFIWKKGIEHVCHFWIEYFEWSL